ncbi:hypothetical protein [Fimbriiglobus ruber]|uniref:hypothetical protein n=1 Tax=Fimbriiglobus ruber TaxID=1908690 RepID=UPI000B4BD466|nr:hypothetical protein [Fimbriiglobus ruber]
MPPLAGQATGQSPPTPHGSVPPASPPAAPTSTPGGSISAEGETLAAGKQGAALTNVVVATFTDTNPFSQVSDFQASITWGDGGTSYGVVTAVAGGGYQVQGSHTYTAADTFSISVDITDVVSGSSGTADSSVTIAPAPVTVTGYNIQAIAGNSFSTVVAGLSETVPAGTSATINWGDGTTDAAQVNETSIRGAHDYESVGSFGVTITVSEAGRDYTATATATVEPAPTTESLWNSTLGVDAALTGDPITIAATEFADYNGQVATFHDASLDSSALGFSATIEWGDGIESPGQVSAESGGNFTISGDHVYTTQGTDLVTVIVEKGGVGKLVLDGIATVAYAPSVPYTPPPVVLPSPPSFFGGRHSSLLQEYHC